MILKARIRQRMLSCRSRININTRKYAAHAVLKQLQGNNRFMQSQHVGLYWPLQTEIDCSPVMQWCWQHQKRVYLPVLKGQMIQFFLHTSNGMISKNRYGIWEPNIHTSSEGHPDFICVPCVAVDRLGFRIGFGTGAYDKVLKKESHAGAHKVYLAFKQTALFDSGHQKHDVKADEVILG